MSVPGDVVVPFAVFVAYQERRRAAAVVPPPAIDAALGVTSLSSAPYEPSLDGSPGGAGLAATALRATAEQEPRS